MAGRASNSPLLGKESKIMDMIGKLREIGCIVFVKHFRERHFVFEIPRHIHKGLAATLVEVNFAARGGATTIRVQTPNCIYADGESNCSHADIFCKKTGRNWALMRCLKQLKSLVSDSVINEIYADLVNQGYIDKD